jgi:hypothetical protein
MHRQQRNLVMNAIRSYSFLRRILLIDAVSSGAMGLGLLALSGALAGLVQLPEALLIEAGIVLLPFAAFVGFLASRPEPSRPGVWIVIGLNVVWAIDSALLLFTGWVSPSLLGYAFVIGQAAVVAVFADLEYVGLKRAARVTA